MASCNRFKFEKKAKGYGAADRHRAPLPPGRCRDLPVLSLPEQIHKMDKAHMLTRSQAKQAAADHEGAMWDANMQLQYAEEELSRERHAHQATKMQLFEAEEELYGAKTDIHDKNHTINVLEQKLAALEVERDRALADAAGLHTALQAAEHTISQHSNVINTMQQQLAAQLSAMSCLHSELAEHMSTSHPTGPQLQQQQQQQQQYLQGNHSHAGLLNTFSGYLSSSIASNTLGRNLVTPPLRTSTNPPAPTPVLDTPAQPDASASITTSTTVIHPTSADSALPFEPVDKDVLGSLKATASSLLGKSKQGVMRGWSKALAFGADSGISIGLSLGATSTPRPSCSSGGSSVDMSRWGSYERSMSAGSSRRCSSSSTSNMSSIHNSNTIAVMQPHVHGAGVSSSSSSSASASILQQC